MKSRQLLAVFFMFSHVPNCHFFRHGTLFENCTQNKINKHDKRKYQRFSGKYFPAD